jgi:hypothetical protein
VDARRNADGTLTVPGRAEGPGIIGDGMITIGPDHPDYQAWDDWLKLRETSER